MTELCFTHESLPGRILFGRGARSRLAAELAEHDCRSLLLIGGSHDRAALDEAAWSLTGVTVERILGVRPHVPVADVARAAELVDGVDIDTVVTIGGGSSTGLGKAVTRLRDLTLVAVPTTYAGSEMTPIWGTTSDGEKRTGRDLRVLPSVVIYDPDLTDGLPAPVTATSSFNALAHCIEALWLPDTSPITIEAAGAAIETIVGNVTTVVRYPADTEARSRLLYGAHRAGTVLAASGTGLLHKTAHTLGGLYDLDHAAMYAVLTPPMVEHHLPTSPTARAVLEGVFGADPAAGLRTLAADLGTPTTLAELGLAADGISPAAVQIGAASGAPVDQVEHLLDVAYRGSAA